MKPFQSPPPPITRADVPLAVLLQRIADLQPAEGADITNPAPTSEEAS